MFITVTKAFTSAALLAAAILDPDGANRPLLLLVVFAGAIIVAVEALRLHEYLWGFGFVVLGLLFNPLLMISLSNPVLRWLDVIGLMTFVVSLFVLRTSPRPVPLSITSRNREGSRFV
jgi:hypothetical protein